MKNSVEIKRLPESLQKSGLGRPEVDVNRLRLQSCRVLYLRSAQVQKDGWIILHQLWIWLWTSTHTGRASAICKLGAV